MDTLRIRRLPGLAPSALAAATALLFLLLPLLGLGGAALGQPATRLSTDSGSLVTASNPLPVTVQGGSATPTGPAGTPNANVVSVQGITGGTTLGVTFANASIAVTQSGTWSVGGPQTAGSAVTGGGLRMMGSDSGTARDIAVTSGGAVFISGSIGVSGNIAPGTAASGNPLLAGGRAASTQPLTRSDGQVTWTYFDSQGRTIDKPYSPADLDWSAWLAYPTGSTASQTVRAAAGSGLRNYVTGLQVGAGDVLTVGCINDGATTLACFRLPAGGGTYPIAFPTPLRTTANTAVTFNIANAQTTYAVYVAAQGYVAP